MGMVDEECDDEQDFDLAGEWDHDVRTEGGLLDIHENAEYFPDCSANKQPNTGPEKHGQPSYCMTF